MTDKDSLLEQLRQIDPAGGEDETEARMRQAVKRRGRAALASSEANRQRRQRSRPRLALGFGAALATGVAAVLIGGGVGDERLDVIAEARAALPSSGELVHYETVTTTSLVDADEAAEQRFAEFARRHWDEYGPDRFEQWSTEGRWRVANPDGGFHPKMFLGEPYHPGFYVPDDELERLGLSEELETPTQEAYANGIDSFYVEDAGVVFESDLGAAGWQTDVGSFPGGVYSGSPSPIGGDLVSVLRDQLDRGVLEDAGPAEVNGRSVRRLVSKGGDLDAEPFESVDFEYDVDAETFEPVRFRSFGGWKGEADSPHPVERVVDEMTFEVYEVLPLDETTEPLLEIDAPEGTTVIEALGPDEQPPRRER